MKKFVFATSLAILSLLFVDDLSAQVVVSNWIDPCDNTTKTVIFPMANVGVLVSYRGMSRTFTAAEARAGALQTWIQEVTEYVPCPTENNEVVNQTATTTATDAAAAAAAAAAEAAAKAAAEEAAAAAAEEAAAAAAD